MTKDPEPQEPTYVKEGEWLYNGRTFYGMGFGCNGHGDLRSELTYLRDWQTWARRQLKSLEAFSSSVHEALNSGDGSYRP